MKITYSISVVLLSFLLFSCEPPVTFRDPQPPGSKNEIDIPRSFRGAYVNLDDSSDLLIGEHEMVRAYSANISISLKDSGNQFVWDADSLLDKVARFHYFAVLKGDSAFATVKLYDTLFHLGESGIIRKFKGHLFLNTKYEEGWEVKKVSLKRGVLSIGSIDDESEIKLLKELSQSDTDSLPPYRFALDRRQFNKFLKENSFQDEDVYLRKSR